MFHYIVVYHENDRFLRRKMVSFQAVKLILLGLITFVIVDLVWLGFLMRDFYAKQLAGKLRMANGAMAPQWPAAVCTWFLLVLGIYLFVLPQSSSLMQAIGFGALYGFIVYGVYDLSNYATLAGWPLEVVVADMLWGCVLNGLIAGVMYYFSNI